ncbi:2-amino-4-hydroxy-6-hydroxymethyldihydropteridine pyrophosphokinase [Corynebacterium occultum]|uniref:2-amino-4-hydroxy-6-hydroxymethyldihydropteridine diphosphokinase n=1 Tax=Corynebacterium occultum TaxID=2675219 RepID=A0A6B8WE99_9CORY|nr:2-amino-4-hydroxy-6-hydroxymethyldihydropteridine diphosphokinase [Corynebacterium occultum]QGU08320.1 2-amino-4-hydroxy-6-hydroxymethyldihydropteridine pyrophosphokinase [Corynebacterium occultum]
MRAVLSIGSNLDDRRALLDTVRSEFSTETRAASGVYATPPWGVVDQDEFLNAVLIVEVEQTPLELLRRGQALEEAAERKRIRRWGPRTLDVDVVQVLDDTGQEVLDDDAVLTLPHPFAVQRAFVLVPWLEADPAARLKGVGLAELIAQLSAEDVAGVRRIGEFSLPQ